MNLFSAKKKKLFIKCKYFNKKQPNSHNNSDYKALEPALHLQKQQNFHF